MSGINLKSENGSMLTTILIVVVFIGLLALAAATLTISENKSQVIHAEEQRAFYAAQSGIEYALKQIVSADTLSEWSEEDLSMGNGSSVDVEVEFVDNNSLRVIATGKSKRYVKTITTTVALLDSSDVSRYAVYSAGSVNGIAARDSVGGDINPSLVLENAPTFPYFDMDSLRAMAQSQGYYYSEDLTVNPSFSPPSGTVVFVEGNLRFVQGNWDGDVYFVSNGDVIFNPSWKNSGDVRMTVYQANPEGSVYIQPGQEGEEDDEEESIDFNIQDGNVVPSESFAAQITVVGAAITYGGLYNVPVTLKCSLDNDEYNPFGEFTQAVTGNVNDDQNPRTYTFPDIYPPNTEISITARSWLKKNSWYSGNSNDHWTPLMTVNSDDNSPYVLVLRDGDPVPNIPGFMDQNSIEDFLAPYIDVEDNEVELEDNQAIYLFELGTSDLNSPAADFQDLVVLVNLAKDVESFAESNNGDGYHEDDCDDGNHHENCQHEGECDENEHHEDCDDDEDEHNVTYLKFTGGLIAKGNIQGTFSGGDDDHEENENGEEDDEHENGQKTLEIIHDQQLLRDFLTKSFNAGPRVILSSKWKSRD